MPTNTPRTGLTTWTTGDNWRTSEFTGNFVRIDSFPGTFICTSTTRPTTWAQAQTGMVIYETDTKLTWHWNGVAWDRNITKGYLGFSERLSDLSTTLTTYSTVVTTNVVIPGGNRKVLVAVECSGVTNSLGLTELAIYRDSTLLAEYYNKGATGAAAANYPEAANYALVDSPTSGTVAYSFQFRTVVGFGGTSTIKATANTRTAISVIEI